MIAIRLWPVAALVFLFTGCQSVRVQTDYDETVDFAGYRTFAWMPAPQEAPRRGRLNDIMDNRIRRAVEDALIADGYQKAGAGRPDLFVVYHTAVQRKIDRTYIDTWGYGRRGRWRRGTVRVDSYREGTLIVDIIDAERRELVWRGVATGVVNDPERAEKKMLDAIERIFEAFPPGATS